MNQNNNHTIDTLISQIEGINQYFTNQVQKQVNVAFTLRNWVIGLYIVEYEQSGNDRAEYGTKLIPTLAKMLQQKGLKGLGETNLKLFRTFYITYPQIGQALPDQLQGIDYHLGMIGQALPDESKNNITCSSDYNLLINRLSFTHIIELLKFIDNPTMRAFYETQAISNNWSTRQLQRAINTMLYERTGLSTDKRTVLQKQEKGEAQNPEDFFRNPYILEFLRMPEKSEYSETDLEQAIISHLQDFLIEAGKGFCFEARQKRITFDNTHYKIDLVFYHRILRCHVLIDLKIGEFTHADSGQMTVYLNYYQEHEMIEGDNPPIGIILCAGKNENLVKYATAGLAPKVLVSKYLVSMPSEEELKGIIEEEQRKLGQ